MPLLRRTSFDPQPAAQEFRRSAEFFRWRRLPACDSYEKDERRLEAYATPNSDSHWKTGMENQGLTPPLAWSRSYALKIFSRPTFTFFVAFRVSRTIRLCWTMKSWS